MSYADITIRDKSIVKRWVQGKRLQDACRVLEKLPHDNELNILDFGSGNGELCRLIAERFPKVKVTCYEPEPSLFAEACDNLKNYPQVAIINNLFGVDTKKFDYIFCLEVFEHLPVFVAKDAIAKILSLLNNDGVFVVGVPHELYLPALLKGIFRMARRFNHFDARPLNVLRCALGFPPKVRPVTELGNGLAYHLEHLGFDYRQLKRILEETFVIDMTFCSPIKVFGRLLNSEIYFVMRKR